MRRLEFGEKLVLAVAFITLVWLFHMKLITTAQFVYKWILETDNPKWYVRFCFHLWMAGILTFAAIMVFQIIKAFKREQKEYDDLLDDTETP